LIENRPPLSTSAIGARMPSQPASQPASEVDDRPHGVASGAIGAIGRNKTLVGRSVSTSLLFVAPRQVAPRDR
jgi:hypothetical protein